MMIKLALLTEMIGIEAHRHFRCCARRKQVCIHAHSTGGLLNMVVEEVAITDWRARGCWTRRVGKFRTIGDDMRS